MGQYDVQQVCMNGHQITSRYHANPELRKNFCRECGEKTIFQCPECNTPIKGFYDIPGVISLGHTEVPSHCDSCGQAFPWQTRKIELTREVKGHGAYDPLDLVLRLCNRFHLVVRQLRERHEARPTLDVEDEYDAQDLLHALLLNFFDDVRPEEWTPSYAGKCSRMDFLLKEEQIVIEVKKTRKGLAAKEIGGQLIEDIARYKQHPDCKTLVCFVYDPEARISNPRGIEMDLARGAEGMVVKVIIVPKGY